MPHRSMIQKMIDDRTVESVLKRGSRSKDEVRALQSILQELGFGSELNWEKYGADGDYGTSTAKAVQAFAERNSMSADGDMVTLAIAKRIIIRFDTLDDVRYLQNAIQGDKVEKRLYRGSSDSAGIVALQTLLNEIGFGAQLNWERYGADGEYGGGTAKAVKAFAEQEDISCDGSRLTRELAELIISKLEVYFGADWAKDSKPAEAASGNLTIRKVIEGGRPRVYVSDATNEVRFTRFKRGVYYVGRQRPIDFINNNRASLGSLGMSDSAINVMIAVSENEGNLDAVNTWDNSFMTFGMFQWTIGAGDSKGELPALVKKIKAADQGLFAEYFGQYGLDLINTGAVYGYFSLNGKKLAAPADKELLRSDAWSYYFWKSGQEPLVQSVQIQHALLRLNRFYRSKSYKIDEYFISDLITSEYGVGLILDNHVNRPGYVKACLKKAMDQAGLSEAENWGTDEELRVIDAYLKIRESYGKYPMTDAAKRAAVTKKYLDDGAISQEHGSFEYNILKA